MRESDRIPLRSYIHKNLNGGGCSGGAWVAPSAPVPFPDDGGVSIDEDGATSRCIVYHIGDSAVPCRECARLYLCPSHAVILPHITQVCA